MPTCSQVTVLLLSVLAGVACGLQPTVGVTDSPSSGGQSWSPALVDTLERLGREDQSGRAALAHAAAAQDTAALFRSLRGDTARSLWLRRTVRERGWPTRTHAGDNASHAAWLILQHSPFYDWQSDMLPMLEQLAERGELARSDLALFTDRVLIHRGEPQRFGSQFDLVDGRLVPAPIADVPQLDARRTGMGLPPMAEYVRTLAEGYRLPVMWPPGPTADLRYAVARPRRVSYASVDSVRSGTNSIVAQAVFDVEFRQGGDGMTVTATTREFGVGATASMGETQPMRPVDVTFRLTPRGLDGADILEKMPDILSPQAAVGIPGSGQFATMLVNLPARALRVGETWTDTLRLSHEEDGMKRDQLTVTHGTYVADTMLDGRTLNVLQFTITQQLTIDRPGAQQHGAVSGANGEARVLWDPARHIPVRYDGAATMSMSMPTSGFSLRMTARSILRESAQ
jgi:hypothetical protein